jgi:hypothetical protein
LREGESENSKLKKLIAEKILENEAMRGILTKSGKALCTPTCGQGADG